MGAGRAYYIASRNGQEILNDFYGAVVREVGPARTSATPVDEVHATTRRRTNDDGSATDYRFYINFSQQPQPVPPPESGETIVFHSAARDGEAAPANDRLPPLGVQVRRIELQGR